MTKEDKKFIENTLLYRMESPIPGEPQLEGVLYIQLKESEHEENILRLSSTFPKISWTPGLPLNMGQNLDVFLVKLKDFIELLKGNEALPYLLLSNRFECIHGDSSKIPMISSLV